jgi:hypothetical protein
MIRKLIRIEHTDGFGMFRRKEDRYRLGECENTNQMYELHTYNFPTPGRDKGLDLNNLSCEDYDKFMEGKFCAFKTLDQFYQWIVKDELTWLLKNHDFKVITIEINDMSIWEGEYQVLYRKEDIINVEDITSLFLD